VTSAPEHERSAQRHPRGSQAFWTLVVALPATLALLRLWIEAGGQLQTTLLLVANVSATNLLATMLLTGTRLITMGLVAIFAVGAILGISADAARDAGRPLRRPLFARWTEATPWWFIVASFALALVTWQILYLPLLLPAFVAVFQTLPSYDELPTAQRLSSLAVVIALYGWLIWPTVADAWRQREFFVVLLLTIPPLLAPLIGGAIPLPMVRAMSWVVQPAVVVLLFWTALPMIKAPVLPLTVTTTTGEDGTSEFIRGSVIDTDDAMTTILLEHGGVRYLDTTTVTARVLCPSEEELPVYQLRVRDYHVEDSLLEALGRRVRPVTITDAACRNVPADTRTTVPPEPAPPG
jgi:hypothetical protein